MYIQLHKDEFIDLIKGRYTLLPCAECEMGMVYWNGDTGDVVPLSEYNRLMEEAPDDHEYCKEECEDCMGLGKVVRFDGEGW